MKNYLKTPPAIRCHKCLPFSNKEGPLQKPVDINLQALIHFPITALNQYWYLKQKVSATTHHLNPFGYSEVGAEKQKAPKSPHI